jgi:hypothetical protein
MKVMMRLRRRSGLDRRGLTQDTDGFSGHRVHVGAGQEEGHRAADS